MSVSKRKKFEKDVDGWKKKFTDLIDGFELKIEKESEDLCGTDKEEIRKKINELKAIRIAISEKHGDLRKANDQVWPDIKKQVDKLMGQIDDEFKQSLAYFH